MTHTEDQISVGPVHQPEDGLGRLITCSVDQLHPHPSFVRHNLVPATHELSALAERGELAFREPLTITQDHSILDGYARWQLACTQGRTSLPCLQYDLSKEEALLWLLQKQQRSPGLNDFSRIRLTLELEPWFKQRARSNQQVGGHRKGSSNLTEADKLDVRSEIAAAAGVSVANVSKVKRLLQEGAPGLLQALREGEVSIHRASVWLQTPEKQLDQLSLHKNRHGITKTIGSLLHAHRLPHPAGEEQLDLHRIGNALAAMDAERKTSILVGTIQTPGKVLLLSNELLQALECQGDLQP